MGSGPGLARSPGGGHGSPLQYSCLQNPTDRGAWQPAVHGVAQSQTQLKRPYVGQETRRTAWIPYLSTEVLTGSVEPLLGPLSWPWWWLHGCFHLVDIHPLCIGVKMCVFSYMCCNSIKSFLLNQTNKLTNKHFATALLLPFWGALLWPPCLAPQNASSTPQLWARPVTITHLLGSVMVGTAGRATGALPRPLSAS